MSESFDRELAKLATRYSPGKTPVSGSGRVVADPQWVRASLARALPDLFGDELTAALKAEGTRTESRVGKPKPRPAKSGTRRRPSPRKVAKPKATRTKPRRK